MFLDSLSTNQAAPCQNNGTCIDGINAYQCDCKNTGFEGEHCEFNIDECATEPCQHNSNCTDGINDYDCSCHPGYTSKNCDVDIR